MYSIAQKTDGKRENMAEFLHRYLQRRFSLDTMVMEWGYNLHDALQRYANDDNIGLFWGVLTGEVSLAEFLHHVVRIYDASTDRKMIHTLDPNERFRFGLGNLINRFSSPANTNLTSFSCSKVPRRIRLL